MPNILNMIQPAAAPRLSGETNAAVEDGLAIASPHAPLVCVGLLSVQTNSATSMDKDSQLR